MIKGLYTAEAGMRPKLARMEILANNLANINTTGFKRDRAFAEALDDASAAREAAGTDNQQTQQYIDFTEGSLNQTGNPLDIALQGRGFLVVETPNGVRYTRNGNLQLALDGSLVTAQGSPVLGTAGRLQLPDVQRLEQGSILISETGEVMVGKQNIGQLRIVDFENPQMLQKDHESLFSALPGARMVEGPGKATTVRQGSLEESNVEGIEEMVAMIEISRGYEADQKSIQAQDATMEKTMEVGKL
jgi:flagellar basal-body rod protein FlgG